MKRIALIVAGGSGSRIGGPIPKQFLLLNGRPMLMYTIEKFHDISDRVIIVLPEIHSAFWQQLCIEHQFTLSVTLVYGGDTRAASVKNGLAVIEEESIVAVHDAARPLVSKKLIDKLYISAANHGNAIPVIPVGETMRMVDGEHNYVVDRSQFRLVQTPQCFKTEMLLKSFHMVDYQNFTDDSSLYQAAGHQIHLEEGEPFNIKVTHPNDFLFAEYYLQSVERNNLKMHSYKN